MVSAIDSSSVSAYAAPVVTSTAGIEAEIARYKKELSSCLNCESADTKQGQADIQSLSNKISIAEARLKESAMASSGSQVAALNQVAEGDKVVDPNLATSLAESDANAQPPTSLEPYESTIGRLLDVYA